jgi:uncharacterized repeat protein (TIGR02543 family)
MGLAGSSASFMRNARYKLHQLLVLVLAVSTLSAVSVVTGPSANASIPTGSIFDFQASNYSPSTGVWQNTGTDQGSVTRTSSDSTNPSKGSTPDSVEFNGSPKGYQFITSKSNYASPNAFTLSVWFKTTSTSGKLIGFENSNGATDSNSYDRQLYIGSDGKLYFGIYNGLTRTVTSADIVNNGMWTHAIATFNGNTLALYMNGSSVPATRSVATPSQYNGNWRIGGYKTNFWDASTADSYFNGSIGRATIYSSVLTTQQLNDFYTVTKSDYAPTCSPSGTDTTTTPGFTILTFTNTTICNWNVPAGVTAADILVVGGGGGAGSGGGGAGGFLAESRTGLSGAIQIVVGSGGAQSAGANLRGSNGGTSSFGDRSAGGGGGGGRGTQAIGSDAPTGATQRGSGGGAAASSSAGKSAGATRGGDTDAGRNIGGGGGGAGADGVGNNSGGISGNGGVGLQSSITGTSTYYSGGGRGAEGGSPGLGYDQPGGGGSTTGGFAQAGVVIVRYANALTVTYNSQSGSAISNGSTRTGGSISSSPGTPTRDGFTFNGWFAASTGGSAITFPYTHGQTANFSLFAQWSPNYSVNVTQTSNGTILFNGSTASETITVTSGADRTFTFAPSAGYEVESIIIDGVSISTPGSPNLTTLQSAIISGYTFSNITSNKTISATYSAISSTNLLLNLDGSRSSSLPGASGATTPTWTSIAPGATVNGTGSSGTQVSTGSTTTPNTPKSVYLNNNGSLSTAGTGASFNFGSTTGVSLGTTGQASAATVEMWINPKSLRQLTNTPWNILFTKWFSTTARAGGAAHSEFHYSLKWDGTAVRQNLFTTSCSDKYGSRTFGTGADFALNTWQLVGFTVDASGNLQFYVNGKTDGSSQSGCGITIRNTPIAFIGDVIQTAGFDGSVAKVRFYNTALSAAAMQSNYNADARLFAKSPIYTITYNYDNATSGNSVQSADYTFGGTTITLPTPSRTGYAFNGWFTQASGGTKIGDGGAAFTPNSSATIFAQWSFNAALNPAFGSPTATADGFTVSITNYDATYTWATPTVSSGSVAVTSTTGSTRVLTVTGLSPGASATITQNTTKAAHANGTATVTGTATTGAARIPTFNTPTRTSDGFTVTITNYDAAFTWDTATVTAGLVSVTSTSGSNRVLTVTGLNPGASATITQTTSRTGYASGSATVSGTASVTVTSLSIGGVTAPVRGATPVTTVTAATGYTGTVTWAAGGTPLVGNFAAGTVYTATITLTAAAGFTFTGVSANSFTVAGATATNSINSGVITAVFPSTIASITYSAGTDGSGTAPSSPTTVAIGGTFTTPFSLYTRAGYSFGGWSDGTNTYAASATYPASGTVTGNVVLTAQWTGVTYTVLFVYNGRTGGDSDASKQFTTGGSAITLPTPTRNGYTFGNWFSNVALTTLVGSAGASYQPTVNLTLYAKWNPINYTVTYNSTNVVGGSTINSSSGTVPSDSTNYNIGQNVSIKSNSGSLARTGYTFAGWVTAADGTGTALNSGQTIEMGSQSINLYPKWTANTYTFTYNLNGGSSDTTTAQATWTVGNSDVTLPTTGITRTGYTFGNGSGGYWSSTQGGAAVANTYSNIGNVTLYAIWTINTISYSFSKGTADGLTIANFPANSSNTFGSTISLPNLAGTTVTIDSNTHLFTGWSYNGTIYRPSESFVLSEVPPTFTAIWTRLYDVRYGFAGGTKAAGDVETDSGDSECVTSGLCTPNQIITLRGAPTRTGYQFAGWKVQDSATIKAAGSTETVTATSYLFYGQWTAIDYVFSFNSTGGSQVIQNQTKNIGQLLTMPDPGSRAGYTFAGWSPDGGTTKLAIGSTSVVGSASQAFVAVWTPDVYTIVYDWQGATGSVTPNASYTVGTGNLSLPVVADRARDGFNFAGWSETALGTTPLSNYQPTTNRVLYAIWTSGSYSLTLNGNGATVATEVISVPRTTSHTLPTRTRSNFKFIGWFDAATGGNFIANAGTSYLVPASQTLFARWVQDSFFGVDEATLETASTFTASDSTAVDSTITHNPTSSSARVQIQAGALTPGTVISVRYFKETSRQQSLIGADKNYFFSVLVSWLLGTGATATVPDTATDKPILVTLTNPAIKAGAMVYRVIGGVVSELQRATVDGSITVELRSDPELVIAAIKPTAPRSAAAASAGSGSSTISWLAPSSNGGSEVIEYTAYVATDPTKSCTTATLSCTITGLTNSTSYNFVVTATNGVGTSPASSPVSATTGTLYAVTFDSKSGSQVSSGTFFTGSTVAEPVAPSKAGFTFAGWSATDGGTAVTFPYAPGVTNDITLFARWDALSYTVTFDAKGGSNVANRSFLNGSTVSEPAAPSRSGFTFDGWSASDGGSAVTFPYAPGVTNAITLYARWTAVTQSGGGGGGSPAPSTPTPSEPVVPLTPAKSNVTVVAPVVVVGDQDAKVLTIDVLVPVAGSNAKPPVIKIDATSEKFIAQARVVEGKLVLTPETGFSGKKTVTVTITENGADRIVQIPLTVLPETVTKPVLTPTASNRSVIRWVASPNATTYTVLLNGRRVCSTSATSCNVSRILGPDAVIEIVSNGGDRTVSQRVEADFRQTAAVSITRLVSATITKASLTAVDTKALDKVVALIKVQGFGTVVISEITTTSKTRALAAARIESIKKYITSKIGDEEVVFEVTPVRSRTYFNNISVKG